MDDEVMGYVLARKLQHDPLLHRHVLQAEIKLALHCDELQFTARLGITASPQQEALSIVSN